MGCTETMTVRISKETSDRCMDVVADYQFHTFSDLFQYAVRLYRDRLARGDIGTVLYSPRTELIEKKVRIDERIVSEIADRTKLRYAEIPEYVLREFLDGWMADFHRET